MCRRIALLATLLTLATCRQLAPYEGDATHDGGKPALDGGKPALDGSRPALDSSRPAIDGGKPQLDGGKPQPDGGKPQLDGGKPQLDGGKPQLDGGKPQPDGGKPQPDGGKPQPDGGKPQPDAAQPDVAQPDSYVGTACASPAKPTHIYPLSGMVICEGPTGVDQCGAAALCAPSHDLCTPAAFQAFGGLTVAPTFTNASWGWLAGCVRPDPLAAPTGPPTASICMPCTSQLGVTAPISKSCDNGATHDSDLGPLGLIATGSRWQFSGSSCGYWYGEQVGYTTRAVLCCRK